LWGISLRNLRNIIYDPQEDHWYKLSLGGQIERHVITLYVSMEELTIHNLLDEQIGEWCILQWADFPRSMDTTSVLSNRDSHAAVAKKLGDTWYILDAAEEGPIDMSTDDIEAKKYFCAIDFINFYVMERDYPHADEREDLIEKWLRIMGYGDMIPQREKARKPRAPGKNKRTEELAHSHHPKQAHQTKTGYQKVNKGGRGNVGVTSGKRGFNAAFKMDTQERVQRLNHVKSKSQPDLLDSSIIEGSGDEDFYDIDIVRKKLTKTSEKGKIITLKRKVQDDDSSGKVRDKRVKNIDVILGDDEEVKYDDFGKIITPKPMTDHDPNGTDSPPRRMFGKADFPNLLDSSDEGHESENAQDQYLLANQQFFNNINSLNKQLTNVIDLVDKANEDQNVDGGKKPKPSPKKVKKVSLISKFKFWKKGEGNEKDKGGKKSGRK
jgi:molybdopterin-guanine dinucleotide biosynthesis protein